MLDPKKPDFFYCFNATHEQNTNNNQKINGSFDDDANQITHTYDTNYIGLLHALNQQIE